LLGQGGYYKEREEKKKKLIMLLVLLMSVGVVVIVAMMQSVRADALMFIGGDILPEGRHASEISEIMQEEVDASQISVQVNTVIEFETARGYGNIGIINPSINKFPIAVDFVLNETGEVIFTSGAIQPNEFISSAPLDVELEEGVHEATAIFNAYDPETNEHVWRSNIGISINIGQ